MSHYLGHRELQLDVNENGYTIVRRGVPARGISEGESTAIALLYFLKSLNDHSFNINTGLVVLDDPVSSLDANAMHHAIGYIRSRTAVAGQLLVLTHNFTFFKEVRNWFKNLQRSDNEKVRFYMLNCSTKDGIRQSAIGNLDPLLERYESDYHFLFAQVYRAVKFEGESLEANYGLPNMARRLLESFLAFRQPQVRSLWDAMRNVKYDEAKKEGIYQFLNAYSHHHEIGESQHDVTILGEAKSIFKDLLELMEKCDPEHYNAMADLANTK